MFQFEYNGKVYPYEDFVQLFAAPSKKALNKGISPATDVYIDSLGTLTIKYEMPDTKPETITVKLEKNELNVTGEKNEIKNDAISLIRQERLSGKYARSFLIGDEFNSDKLSASYKDGLLTVTIPRHEDKQPKIFKVSTS